MEPIAYPHSPNPKIYNLMFIVVIIWKLTLWALITTLAHKKVISSFI